MALPGNSRTRHNCRLQAGNKLRCRYNVTQAGLINEIIISETLEMDETRGKMLNITIDKTTASGNDICGGRRNQTI